MRPRALRGDERAYQGSATVEEPWRRWGSKTGVLGVWGLGVDGRQVLLRLATAPRASDERGLEGLWALGQRGLQTPVTLPTDGASGLLKALDFLWPRSLRLRCWLHKRQKWAAPGPAQAWPACKALVVDRRDTPVWRQASGASSPC